MKTNRVRRVVAATFLLVTSFGPAVRCEWSGDPASNLVVSDRPGEQVQAKLVPTGDGGAYISWFDNADGGYDVYLQRLDAAGDEQWPHNGILVADRGFSSTQDYGLAVDTAGNALLAFRDDQGANVQIAASRVAPDGTLLWGPSGIQVTATTDFVAAPKIAGTSDGNAVVAWTQDVRVMAQKLDAAGSPLWGGGVNFAPAAGSYAVSDLRASDAGNAIVSWVHTTGGFGTPMHLWTQKLAAAGGASLWAPSHVKVYDEAAGSLQFGNFPTFLPDGAGGAVFAWYTSSPSLQVRAQRILAGGSEAFAHNGVEASTEASRLRVNPSVAWNPAAEEVLVFWTELNGAQSEFGVHGQKLASGGARLWTDSGRELVPLGANEITQVNALPCADGALVAWVETVVFGDKPIHSARVDGAGDFVWTPAVTELATSATGTSRLGSALSTAGFAMFTWSDGESGTFDVLAQNLGKDGSLGVQIIFADGFESGDTSAWSGTVP